MAMAMFSVVVTNWNRADALPVSLLSILRQRNVDLEVIIIDDASDDDSLKVAKRYKALDPRIRIYETHESLTWNICLPFNIGLKRARYSLVVMNPSDTIQLSPHNFEMYGKTAEENPSVGWFDSTLRSISGQGKQIAIAGACFRKTILEEITGYDERMKGWGSNEPDLVNRLNMAHSDMRKPGAKVLHVDARLRYEDPAKLLTMLQETGFDRDGLNRIQGRFCAGKYVGRGPMKEMPPDQRAWSIHKKNVETGNKAPNKTCWGEHPKLEEIM